MMNKTFFSFFSNRFGQLPDDQFDALIEAFSDSGTCEEPRGRLGTGAAPLLEYDCKCCTEET